MVYKLISSNWDSDEPATQLIGTMFSFPISGTDLRFPLLAPTNRRRSWYLVLLSFIQSYLFLLTSQGINIFLDGFVPTENLRFRESSLTFKVSETAEVGLHWFFSKMAFIFLFHYCKSKHVFQIVFIA